MTGVEWVAIVMLVIGVASIANTASSIERRVQDVHDTMLEIDSKLSAIDVHVSSLEDLVSRASPPTWDGLP